MCLPDRRMEVQFFFNSKLEHEVIPSSVFWRKSGGGGVTYGGQEQCGCGFVDLTFMPQAG